MKLTLFGKKKTTIKRGFKGIEHIKKTQLKVFFFQICHFFCINLLYPCFQLTYSRTSRKIEPLVLCLALMSHNSFSTRHTVNYILIMPVYFFNFDAMYMSWYAVVWILWKPDFQVDCGSKFYICDILSIFVKQIDDTAGIIKVN